MKPNLLCFTGKGKEHQKVALRVSNYDLTRLVRHSRDSLRVIRLKDLDSGQIWRIRHASCCQPCRCTALAVKEVP